ncbi:MAG TPA: hypothetical protein VLL25_20265 [Acidimicrobiales bacterium]|nr:hypothetical protein [Acidimicrobiales bacterium]
MQVGGLDPAPENVALTRGQIERVRGTDSNGAGDLVTSSTRIPEVPRYPTGFQAANERRRQEALARKGQVAATTDHPSPPVSEPPAPTERALPVPESNGAVSTTLDPVGLAVALVRQLPGCQVTIKLPGARLKVRV